MNEAGAFKIMPKKVDIRIMLQHSVHQQAGMANGTILRIEHLVDVTITRRSRVTSIMRMQSSSHVDHVNKVLDPKDCAVFTLHPADEYCAAT